MQSFRFVLFTVFELQGSKLNNKKKKKKKKGLGPLPSMNPVDFMYTYMHKKRRETRK